MPHLHYLLYSETPSSSRSGRISFRYFPAEFPFAFAPLAAIPARTERAGATRRVDSIPHRLLHHRVKHLCIPLLFCSDFATLLHELHASSGNAAGVFLGNRLITHFSTKAFDYMFTLHMSRAQESIATTISFFVGFATCNNDCTEDDADYVDYVGISHDTNRSDASNAAYQCVTRSARGTRTRTAITGSVADTAMHVFRVTTINPADGTQAAGTVYCAVDTNTSAAVTVATTAALKPVCMWHA